MATKYFYRLAALSLVIALFTGANLGAQAITPAIVTKPMTLISNLDSGASAQGLLVKKELIYLFGTSAGADNSDGYVQSISPTGEIQWTLPLDTGGDDIATAGSLDSFGNIWVAGSSVLNPSVGEPVSSDPSSALNPDSITLTPKIPLRSDLKLVTIWLISPQGNLLATYSTNVGRAVLARAITVTNTTVSIVGIASTTLGNSGFLIQGTRKGSFSKILLIGKSGTEINSITKRGANLVLLGGSSETLFGKARAAERDAILLSFTSSGKFLSIIRSSDAGSSRTWQSGTPTILVGGDAITGAKSEAVVTKYSAKFTPIWTTRYPSAGVALTLDTLASAQIFFSSIGPVTGVKYWNPAKAQLLSLIFDKKGLLTGAFSVKGATSPIAVGFSRELGAVLLSRGQAGVSVFRTLTM